MHLQAKDIKKESGVSSREGKELKGKETKETSKEEKPSERDKERDRKDRHKDERGRRDKDKERDKDRNRDRESRHDREKRDREKSDDRERERDKERSRKEEANKRAIEKNKQQLIKDGFQPPPLLLDSKGREVDTQGNILSSKGIRDVVTSIKVIIIFTSSNSSKGQQKVSSEAEDVRFGTFDQRKGQQEEHILRSFAFCAKAR
jgi:hypothetical protein